MGDPDTGPAWRTEERAKGIPTRSDGGRGRGEGEEAGATIERTIFSMSKRESVVIFLPDRRTTLGSREHFERRGD